MTATLKPLKSPDPVPQTKPSMLREREDRTSIQKPGATAHGIAPARGIANELKGVEPATALSRDGGGKRFDGRVVQGPVDRPGVEMRVSVVDAADRLLYVDLRDRRGWQQPLAAGSAEGEARHRGKSDGGFPASEPRTLITTMAAKAGPSQNNAGVAPVGVTPYSAGKAGVASRVPVGPTRVVDGAKQPQVRAKSMGRLPARKKTGSKRSHSGRPIRRPRSSIAEPPLVAATLDHRHRSGHHASVPVHDHRLDSHP